MGRGYHDLHSLLRLSDGCQVEARGECFCTLSTLELESLRLRREEIFSALPWLAALRGNETLRRRKSVIRHHGWEHQARLEFKYDLPYLSWATTLQIALLYKRDFRHFNLAIVF